MTSTPTRPVDNVVITTKGLQDRNMYILDGTTVENKGKLMGYSYMPENIKLLLAAILVTYQHFSDFFKFSLSSRVLNFMNPMY